MRNVFRPSLKRQLVSQGESPQAAWHKLVRPVLAARNHGFTTQINAWHYCTAMSLIGQLPEAVVRLYIAVDELEGLGRNNQEAGECGNS